jgi:fatty-acyl-CoA synthase
MPAYTGNGDYTSRMARHWGAREAVFDVAKGEAGRFTYAQLDARARALSGWLAARGVKQGDRVGLVAHNGVEVLDALYAASRLGAALVPFNWRLHASELAQLFDLTTPAVVLHGAEFAALTSESVALSKIRPALLDVESPAYAAALSNLGDVPPPAEGVSPEDPLCLLFTGGTTGIPKAARISHRMVAYNTLTLLTHEARTGDCTITHTPMFHTGGLLVYTVPLLSVGGRVILLRRWNAGLALGLLTSEKPTIFFAVPTQYEELRQQPEWAQADLSSLRFMTSGGAPLSLALIEAWQARHAVPFKQGFGMTEFGPGCFSMGPEHAVRKAGSIGMANCHVEAKLVDEHGVEVPVGQVGELLLAGPACFSGYHEMRAETAAAFDGFERTGTAGWFHTGDLARKDEEGFFFIVGRKKDMFISGGENVYPIEIEQVLYQHAAVASCAVVGLPDPKWGETGHAFVVLKPGAFATEAALAEHLRGKLARYKQPKSITLLPALPLTPAGKVKKHELRAHALAKVQP